MEGVDDAAAKGLVEGGWAFPKGLAVVVLAPKGLDVEAVPKGLAELAAPKGLGVLVDDALPNGLVVLVGAVLPNADLGCSDALESVEFAAAHTDFESFCC